MVYDDYKIIATCIQTQYHKVEEKWKKSELIINPKVQLDRLF